MKTTGEAVAIDRNNWAHSTTELRRRLAQAIPHDTLQQLHQCNPWAHFAVFLWQWLLIGAAGYLAWTRDEFWIWIPAAIVLGFTFFNFTVMLHEVVHDAVWKKKGRRTALAVLGWMYAFPSGISRAQFTRWHLDHHAGLGDWNADPKRHHLSPKRNARWYKALYMTPALIPIYFRAASKETGTYEPELRRTIMLERLTTVIGQLAIMLSIGSLAGWWIAFKVYIVPYFLVFPVAFTLNRLGQHYNIDPDDPAKWSTLVKPSYFWDVGYLWSSYHLEHHYFPRVPFYRLRKLHMQLKPFYQEIGFEPTTYRSLLWNWFVLNRKPHSKWAVADDDSAFGSPAVDGQLAK
jgi:fatty acid desaturase